MKRLTSQRATKLPFFTIGHSTRSIEDFVELLKAADIDVVVDIRKIPRSRTNPQYNRDVIAANLKPFGLAYTAIDELGGRRPKNRELSQKINGLWRNQSFHNYADYALSEEFELGLEKLIKLGRKKRCALMCSEAVWWRCHRRIVADYLLARGESVFHLMGSNLIEPAHLTEGARIARAKKVRYPSADER